ncbi:hypothetical protein IFM60648_03966 [Aspergillus lentulus]|uniref:Uncharacterized protein n=1 Tax=Aspergillus lentulus TaxID=293939 RepID=A0ABQ1A4T0_ASPLE|nr:hypothetical protein IFM60648_03966 [Aspergillus lentulus]
MLFHSAAAMEAPRSQSDNAWPGAFASVRRHKEEILRIDAAAPKRNASPVLYTWEFRPRAANAIVPGPYGEDVSFEEIGISGAAQKTSGYPLYGGEGPVLM